MRNKIIGCFYFKKTQSGNLIGEFSNNGIDTFITECANIKEGFEVNNYDAEYITTWLEDFNPHIAELKIIKTEKKFKLKWCHLNKETIIFEGTAILESNILIGKYNSK